MQSDFTTMRVKKDTLERLRLIQIVNFFNGIELSEIINKSLDKSGFESLEELKNKKEQQMNIKTPFD